MHRNKATGAFFLLDGAERVVYCRESGIAEHSSSSMSCGALGYDSTAKAGLMFGLGSPRPALDYLLFHSNNYFSSMLYMS